MAACHRSITLPLLFVPPTVDSQRSKLRHFIRLGTAAASGVIVVSGVGAVSGHVALQAMRAGWARGVGRDLVPLWAGGWKPDSELVSMRPRRAAGGSATGGRDSAVEQWASRRQLYLDNVKVLLIAAIIAGHGIAGYSELGFWPYAEMREVTLSPVTETVLLAIVVPFGLFMIPLLFLVAGLLTPASLERKGTRAYVGDRLLRLGVPLAVFVLVLWPLLMYPVHPPGESPGSYWAEFLRHGSIDTGVLWFVGVLLIFSLAYAGWVWVRRGHGGQLWRGEVSLRYLLVLVAAVTAATFLVRLALPYYSDNKYVDLNVYQWPECAALFGLGIVAFRNGWLTAVPDRLHRQCRTATLTAAGGFAAFMAFGAAVGVVGEHVWRGGWHWEALVFAALESAVSVFGPVWLLGVAQPHLNRRVRWAGPAISRSAYGAFIVQGLPLIGLAVALRPMPLPAEAKALMVAGGGVVGSFALAWLLISRVPLILRIL